MLHHADGFCLTVKFIGRGPKIKAPGDPKKTKANTFRTTSTWREWAIDRPGTLTLSSSSSSTTKHEEQGDDTKKEPTHVSMIAHKRVVISVLALDL